MISHLHIENYALIENISIDFSKGFSVITGETGAGKSIILGALSLIMGNRADTSMLKNAKEKCIVEGEFNIQNYNLADFFTKYNLDYESETIVRREISPTGKSRAFINDTPVNLSILKEFSDSLVDIHSQFQTHKLEDRDFLVSIIDNVANINDRVSEYNTDLQSLRSGQKKLEKLKEEQRSLLNEKDYNQFLFNEMQEASLGENEQEELEKEIDILQHAEEIKKGLYESNSYLQMDEDNLIDKLETVKSNLQKLGSFHSEIEKLAGRLESGIIEIKDIAEELSGIESDIDVDPGRLELLTERLDLIYKLQQKHNARSVAELIEIKNKIEIKLNNADNLDSEIELLERELRQQHDQLTEKANDISTFRKKTIPQVEKKMIEQIGLLGMPHASLTIHIKPLSDFSLNGKDQVVFLFSANKGTDQGDISKVASGGERSRIMLVIKSIISKSKQLPTLILDEIDIGVSGEIAGKMGSILLGMSKSMQVIVITHLPQIAGKGEHHFVVFKETKDIKTKTLIKQITDNERVMEVAKMMSDQQITESALKAAEELLSMN